MRARILGAIFLLMGFCVAASAQEMPWKDRKAFSVELGTGFPPFHMAIIYVSPSYGVLKNLADKGQDAKVRYMPAVSLSGVWRTKPRWEFMTTVGASWSFCEMTQYEPFGIDPAGKPRYDLKSGTRIGWRNFSPVITLNANWRYLWNPGRTVELYSGIGFGLTSLTFLLPIPSITPIGLRAGWEHCYVFAEFLSLNPYATSLHGGLGWRF